MSTLIIPNTVVKIGKGAFCNAEINGDIFVVPASVTVIEKDAFYGCSIGGTMLVDSDALIKDHFVWDVEFGENCTELPDYWFSTCFGDLSLRSIEIPDHVTKIGAYAFSGRYSLYTVKIGSGVVDYAPTAFEGCSLVDVMVDSQAVVDQITSYDVAIAGSMYLYIRADLVLTSFLDSMYDGTTQEIDGVTYMVL